VSGTHKFNCHINQHNVKSLPKSLQKLLKFPHNMLNPEKKEIGWLSRLHVLNFEMTLWATTVSLAKTKVRVWELS